MTSTPEAPRAATPSRGGTALKGAVAAGAATAVLLGGFGAFALWTDSQDAGAAGQIATGELVLDEITDPVSWQLENPEGGGAVPIDLATYVASPGDVISYTVTATGVVRGTDLTAELGVELRDVAIHADVQDDVTIEAASAEGAPIRITGTEEGTTFSRDVTVTVTFDEAMTGGMDLVDAVGVGGLDLVLQQV